MKICCFTGHRTVPAEVRAQLIVRLDRLLEELFAQGFTEFRTGGARGFDTLAALRVLYLREKHREVRLSLILPCRDQTRGWPLGEKMIFEDILSRADSARVLYESYMPGCMHARNRALVKGSDLCVAYLTDRRGGTQYTCNYANAAGVPLYNIAIDL